MPWSVLVPGYCLPDYCLPDYCLPDCCLPDYRLPGYRLPRLVRARRMAREDWIGSGRMDWVGQGGLREVGWSWQNGLTRARWMVTVSQLTRALIFVPETTKSAVRHWCRCVGSFSHHRPSQARPHRPQCPSNRAFTCKDIASVLRRRPRNHPWLVFGAWIGSLVQSLLALPHARKGLAANRSTGLENARIAGRASWWSRTARPHVVSRGNHS